MPNKVYSLGLELLEPLRVLSTLYRENRPLSLADMRSFGKVPNDLPNNIATYASLPIHPTHKVPNWNQLTLAERTPLLQEWRESLPQDHPARREHHNVPWAFRDNIIWSTFPPGGLTRVHKNKYVLSPEARRWFESLDWGSAHPRVVLLKPNVSPENIDMGELTEVLRRATDAGVVGARELLAKIVYTTSTSSTKTMAALQAVYAAIVDGIPLSKEYSYFFDQSNKTELQTEFVKVGATAELLEFVLQAAQEPQKMNTPENSDFLDLLYSLTN